MSSWRKQVIVRCMSFSCNSSRSAGQERRTGLQRSARRAHRQGLAQRTKVEERKTWLHRLPGGRPRGSRRLETLAHTANDGDMVRAESAAWAIAEAAQTRSRTKAMARAANLWFQDIERPC